MAVVAFKWEEKQLMLMQNRENRESWQVLLHSSFYVFILWIQYTLLINTDFTFISFLTGVKPGKRGGLGWRKTDIGRILWTKRWDMVWYFQTRPSCFSCGCNAVWQCQPLRVNSSCFLKGLIHSYVFLFLNLGTIFVDLMGLLYRAH